jgi:hypothetical protein
MLSAMQYPTLLPHNFQFRGIIFQPGAEINRYRFFFTQPKRVFLPFVFHDPSTLIITKAV